jgi:hypothetical protein
MKILNRDEILSADDLEKKKVHVPEWGGSVFIRMMTGAERDAYEIMMFGEDNKKKTFVNMRAKFLAFTIVDESGKPIFTDSDIEALGKKGIKPIDRVYTAARKLNALSDEDVDEILKKSDPNPPDNSISS